MVLYQAEYMVGGTCWLPSKMIENQGASLGRLAMKDRFSAMVRISERTSEIRTHANGASGRIGVKGQDKRQSTAPLTPTRPLRELARCFCLTAEEAVIHGAHGIHWNVAEYNRFVMRKKPTQLSLSILRRGMASLAVMAYH